MVNKLKRFFQSIGKPSGGSASLSSAFPVLASNDNQFYHQYEFGSTHRGNNSRSSNQAHNNNMPVLMAHTSAENSGSGSDNMASPHRSGGGDAIRWGLLLPRIPCLVAEATAVAAPLAGSASPSSSGAAAARAAAASDNSVEMAMLLEMLTQMAPKEAQTQILQFYIGDSNNNNGVGATVPVANWEQRKVFRQVRRALLLCWKFIVAQLNDNNAQLTSEMRETYFQLIGLIAERIEFHLSPDSSSPAVSSSNASATSMSTRSRQQNNSGHMMGWTVHSPTASAPSRQQNSSSHMMGWSANSPTASAASPLANPADLTSSSDANGPSTTSTNATGAASDDTADGERDLYLYRCLLVATFKFVIENIDGAKASKRSWVTIAELQFFAKVLAICFFRIPVLQRLIVDQIYATYRQKRWTNTATTATTAAADDSRSTSSQPATPDSRAQRRRSSSRLSSGLTFTGSLSRWSEFEGRVLCEVTPSMASSSSTNAFEDSAASPRDPATPSPSSSSSPGASFQTRAALDKFKRLNPTLFRWTRYVPYLTPYTDTDVFRMNDAMKLSWLEKLSHDGEFFALFMSAYAQHAETCAVGDVVWSALPAYALLIRVALLLLKEASWAKWLFIRDNTLNSAPSSLYDSPSAGSRTMREPFEIRSIRSIRAVLDNVVHWLRNRELLESCTLALMECTNVLHSRSVGVCLTRCEEWFRVSAVPVPSDNSSDQPVAYRLPSSFSGLTFALGIRLMLSSESFETLTRTLQFLYDCLAYFDGELRQHVLKVLVQRHMFLFLHWHADVRSAYHHILVYKLARVNRFFLDSPIDHLLIGRHATLHFDASDNNNGSGTSGSSSSAGPSVAHGFDDFDDHLGGGAPYANVHSNSSASNSGSRPFQISAAEFSALRTEQALWRAFDACISAICVHERRNAKDGNRKYQYELQCAQSRAVAFQKLTRATADDLAPSSSVNEGLPGGKPWIELDLLDEELRREPPYYLRYLPAEDVSSIDELRRLASTLRYPLELHVYAPASLRHYSDLLKKYYEALSRNKYVEAPPLGFV